MNPDEYDLELCLQVGRNVDGRLGMENVLQIFSAETIQIQYIQFYTGTQVL